MVRQVFKVQKKILYAIEAVVDIAMNSGTEPVQNISIAERQGIPKRYLEQTLQELVKSKILVGSKTGEGVFGVSFKIKGPPKSLETTVNPIKTLTPRFITRTLEKIKKNN